MGDPSFLGFLCYFGLSLCHRSHKGDQGIADGLLHRISSRAIERHSIYDRLNTNSPPNELAYSIRHVLIVPPKAINPAHQGVSLSQNIEKSTTLGAFTKAGRDTRDAMISQHQVWFKSILVSLGELVINFLI